MSLRLLPAFTMDNDDDDDGNFTKWMSSYWGHGAEGGHSRERKHSFRRPARTQGDRRASLPTVSQLDAMKLSRLHAAAMAPSPSHIKTREEKAEVRPHQRARRASSDDNSRQKNTIPENRITTIPELTESFEKRLCVHDKRAVSLNGDERLCLICHEDMRTNGGVQELHCTHRFHKEAARRLEQCRPHSSGKEAAASQARRLSDERRKSADGPIYMEKEQQTLLRQLSLRRHR
ncbi:leukemia NUP98 fusion partner 1 isoform X1 [Hippoglossus hippoglossus]|uniref:leukemia NUP98 fusion partner 1 isoform X1 n=1 Tax=Hippoglossus hippoglossus TaxID=8267 RepID=UPI00148DE399|nr:leukemia NUP98 fusion partner 1 isoform X1 [Hippoglossus hippoglossus]XP_034439177.1 leukemia NUP98 fusion partner 1 isoform X1 [Hippoglossus hippoglossus]XP_035033004.1 leukemia NUP98 fusion partner 1 isoform X1 [Hippoglossus stenolepis]XP_035033005.1 leukemia NUP98 fusion partner 1 isoform X1 [Hippoglossus stenolepis]XP_047199071.1 leukemia NUP98 fusion partner 1 isoform X1 [Hippoglossus stenolepis]